MSERAWKMTATTFEEAKAECERLRTLVLAMERTSKRRAGLVEWRWDGPNGSPFVAVVCAPGADEVAIVVALRHGIRRFYSELTNLAHAIEDERLPPRRPMPNDVTLTLTQAQCDALERVLAAWHGAVLDYSDGMGEHKCASSKEGDALDTVRGRHRLETDAVLDALRRPKARAK